MKITATVKSLVLEFVADSRRSSSSLNRASFFYIENKPW